MELVCLEHISWSRSGTTSLKRATCKGVGKLKCERKFREMQNLGHDAPKQLTQRCFNTFKNKCNRIDTFNAYIPKTNMVNQDMFFLGQLQNKHAPFFTTRKAHPTWKIIPFSKLVTPIYTFRPFGPTTLIRGLTITIVANYQT